MAVNWEVIRFTPYFFGLAVLCMLAMTFMAAISRRSLLASTCRPPHWREWSDTQVAQFQRICGELMSQLGYGHEPQWQEKCARAAATS